jgi:hypothetical protein
LYNNNFAFRERDFNTGLAAFHKYAHGEAYWTWKFSGNATVDGQGTKADYWNYEYFVNHAYFHPDTEASYC